MQQNVILVDIVPHDTTKTELAFRMEELTSLVNTYGDLVVVEYVQKRDTVDYHTYVGTGKLEEMARAAEELEADLLIIGNILKPAQVYHVQEHLRSLKSKLQVWDRIDLILKIFAAHAHSPEAKLQIELASIRHMGPRIFGMGMELSRQGWGVGTRGLGETNTEIMKRHLRREEQKIREKLSKYQAMRWEHRKARRRKNLPTVGIVGYTNAGKSTLMNRLTHKGVVSQNQLFTTLGTSVGSMYVADGSERGVNILLSDTIGFIRDLPPELIEAFASTLEDSVESDLLLHVVDANDPRIAEKIAIVQDTLEHIEAHQGRILVFNKCDQLGEEARTKLLEIYPPNNTCVWVSAYSGEGIDSLKQMILKHTLANPTLV